MVSSLLKEITKFLLAKNFELISFDLRGEERVSNSLGWTLAEVTTYKLV